MVKKFSVLTNSKEVKELEDLINKNYKPKEYNCMIESHLSDILYRVSRDSIKARIKDLWYSLHNTVGYEIGLVYNTIQNSTTTLRLNTSIVVNISADDKNSDIVKSLQDNTDIIIKFRQVDVTEVLPPIMQEKREAISGK
ncbi:MULTISPECIES: hypothetical protein [unclassified Francisella]|uniref:hypothetical protein n=1 Tax=unclassified Francisella TaxID=2610885 RepID=UPI002E36885F|nr:MULTISPECIES: hypothetical protein [unclassified Francisella]MED7820380.1 hypothetical protein [Francisella sp. 19S2-4]MED7831215.1 hypothetical protein [Francisella sp. 19S2-10]